MELFDHDGVRMQKSEGELMNPVELPQLTKHVNHCNVPGLQTRRYGSPWHGQPRSGHGILQSSSNRGMNQDHASYLLTSSYCIAF